MKSGRVRQHFYNGRSRTIAKYIFGDPEYKLVRKHYYYYLQLYHEDYRVRRRSNNLLTSLVRLDTQSDLFSE